MQKGVKGIGIAAACDVFLPEAQKVATLLNDKKSKSRPRLSSLPSAPRSGMGFTASGSICYVDTAGVRAA